MAKGNELAKRNGSAMRPLNDSGMMMRATYDMTRWPKIDWHDPEQVDERINLFFRYSSEHDLIPLPSTLAMALGCSTSILKKWRSGERRMNARVLEIINNAYNLIIANLQMAGLTGRVNVIQALSIQHNMGVQDNPDKVEQEAIIDDRQQTAAEIRQKYQDMDEMD